MQGFTQDQNKGASEQFADDHQIEQNDNANGPRANPTNDISNITNDKDMQGQKGPSPGVKDGRLSGPDSTRKL